MSTILKALQRLEDEKSASVERSLDEQVVSHHAPPDPEPDRRGLKIAIAAVGGLAVAAAAFLFWPAREDPAAEVAMDPPTAVAPVAAAAPEAVQKLATEKSRRKASTRTQPAARAQAESAGIETSSVVEVVERLDDQLADSGASGETPIGVAVVAKPNPTNRRPGARKPDVQVAGRAAQPDAESVQVVDTRLAANRNTAPVELAKSAEPAPAKPAAPDPVRIAAVAPKPAPASASIPASVREPEKKVIQRAKMPALSIEKTIWHPDNDRRIAIVKLDDAEKPLRLKEGDAIGPLVVESIKPGSVLFNHDGIEIVFNVGS